ncbi:hypothetical protein BH10CYA1_BH10CYA1_08250 [soil metagenome]
MDYLLSLSDDGQQHMVIFTLPENIVRHNAIDVVIDVIGDENVNELVAKNLVAEGYLDDLRALQRMIFDKDQQGIFIRDSISFTANNAELNPDAPLMQAFAPAMRDGVKYFRSDLSVIGGANGSSSSPSGGASSSAVNNPKELSATFFLHQICVGRQLDVTKDHIELDETLKQAERDGLVEVDVKQASYRSTPKGKAKHDSIMTEAQNLIKRYDIYCDVDIDSSGTARFDTGLGRDLRVPVYELEGVDPFRARFLLGLNDGEWDKMEDWTDVVEDSKWYASIMEPIERAPSVDEIGRSKVQSIIEQGKAKLREESQFR